MLLAVDIGNTNLVFGLFVGDELQQTFRLSTVQGRTEDELAALISQLFALRHIEASLIDASIVASVVPPVTDAVCRAIETVIGTAPLCVGGPGLKTGIRIRYDNPREVGADRIVNAVAAHHRGEGAVIVVDFGTATTFDCVASDGEYLGGVIVPGVQVSLEGLLARTAKLPRIDLAEPPQVIGRNTPHAMQSGIIHGYAALVDGLVEKIRAEMPEPCRVIATGGLAGRICVHASSVDEVRADLTLDGLRLVYERNRGTARARTAPRA